MKRINNLTLAFLAGAAVLSSCQREFKATPLAENGPEVTVHKYSENAYMGADIYFSVEMLDPEFALSTLKAQLYYDADMVSETVIRTKEQGVYDGTVSIPLVAGIPDGNAMLVFTGQNIGQAITRDTVYVAVKRPDFQTLTLRPANGGDDYTLTRLSEDKTSPDYYVYSLATDFPASLEANIVTPAVNEEGDVISLGWDGTSITTATDFGIPFANVKSGVYTVSVDMFNLTAEPLGSLSIKVSEDKPSVVVPLTQGSELKFPDIPGIAGWDLDVDFFTLSEDNVINFVPVDGLYRITADFDKSFLKVEAMKDENTVASLNDDGTGAVWMLGYGVGKPAPGPAWTEHAGAWCLSQVKPQVYQITLVGGATMVTSGADFKLFHQDAYGGEFGSGSYAETDLDDLFYVTDEGNIKVNPDSTVTVGQYYRFTLDLTGGNDAAKLSMERVEGPGITLDIFFAGEKAIKVSPILYNVPVVHLEQGQNITIEGIDMAALATAFPDPDYLEVDFSSGSIKFAAATGYYSVDLHLDDHMYMILKRVTESGTEANLGGGALWLMAHGIGTNILSNPVGFDPGLAFCMAEIRPMVFQFTGYAVPEDDSAVLGGRFRNDYISFKLFYQNGWGGEMGIVSFTEGAAQYLCQSPEDDLTDSQGKAGTNIRFRTGVALETGGLYRMTVDMSKGTVDGASYTGDIVIDFVKLM